MRVGNASPLIHLFARISLSGSFRNRNGEPVTPYQQKIDRYVTGHASQPRTGPAPLLI